MFLRIKSDVDRSVNSGTWNPVFFHTNTIIRTKLHYMRLMNTNVSYSNAQKCVGQRNSFHNTLFNCLLIFCLCNFSHKFGTHVVVGLTIQKFITATAFLRLKRANIAKHAKSNDNLYKLCFFSKLKHKLTSLFRIHLFIWRSLSSFSCILIKHSPDWLESTCSGYKHWEILKI